MTDLLKKYKAKRNFAITPEPDSTETGTEVATGGAGALSFVIQKHWATRLHYDFRLELDGAMKSWAVPKGPSLDPHDKRMAVHVEDHPISYNKFEGQIPARQYGAGKVIIWDKGYWEPIGDVASDYKAGHLKFDLHGHKLRGRWALIRMKSRGEKQEAWLLIKEKDSFARAADAFSVIDEMPDSVARLKAPAPPKTAPKSTAGLKSVALKSATSKSTAVKRARPEDAAKTAIKGAIKSALPDKLSPQLATLVDAPPADADGWQYEIKFDGYRLLARIDGKSIRLFTRNGNDWTAQLPALAASLAKMKLPPGWYDGEIVALDSKGMPDFQALQQAFDGSHTQDIVYYLFDLPYCGGYDLRKVQLHERRAMLASLLEKAPADIRFSDTFDIEASEILASACKMGLEGMIGKRQDSTYELRRSSNWIKLKCSQRQEFLICGYTDPQGSRTAIGSLLLGIHDENGRLRYAGNVGTGFDDRALAELLKKLKPLHTDETPFEGPTGRYRKPHWVKPVLLAEVSFAQWTGDGHIRHSVFQGLRTDKKPRAITREKPVAIKSVSQKSSKSPESQQSLEDQPRLQSPLAGLKITHPERVIDASSDATKIDLIRYYALVAPLMMAHLKSRPVSLVRAPNGIAGQLFFQKHFERANMPGIRALSKSLDTEHPPYLEVAEPGGLLSAAQMNVIEFHTWNGVKSSITKPDRFSFDLDPGEKSEWPAMQEAALLVRSFLQELGLESLVKTSGGKGLHVVVPIRKQYDWDTIKDFSRTIVEHLAATLPERFSAKSGPRNRVGKIFIDYLRNGFGATTACAWSARARPGLGVSVPIAWDEVEKLHGSAQWNIANIHTRLDHGNTPWENVPFLSQSPAQGMKALGFEATSKKK
jgi:bifunctional non-homologous end joining protein LigD